MSFLAEGGAELCVIACLVSKQHGATCPMYIRLAQLLSIQDIQAPASLSLFVPNVTEMLNLEILFHTVYQQHHQATLDVSHGLHDHDGSYFHEVSYVTQGIVGHVGATQSSP